MAYMNQTKKAEIAPKVKAILKKYNVKGTLSVRNHSSLCLNIKSGAIDFIGNTNKTCGNDHYQTARGFTPLKDYIQVNPYHYGDHFSGKAKNFLSEVITAMNHGNYDHSDIQTDYFCVGHYIHVNIGAWDTPYQVTA